MEERLPRIRFKEFEEQWMQQTFAESFVFLKNNTLSREELHTDGLAENIHYGDILIRFEECIDPQKELLPKISNDKLIQKLKTSFLQDGDVIIADTAEDETVGKCSEINNIGNKIVVSGLHTMPCRPKGKYKDGYLGYYMNSPSYHNQLFPLMQGTKVTSISKNAISETIISFPVSKLEQGMISQFLQRTTSLITLTQQKLDQLKTFKKACLEKMFPREGETVPEIRFKGFEEKWKSFRFGDIVQIERGGSPRPIDEYITDSPNGLNWIKIGDAPALGRYITHTAEKIKPEGLSKTREVHPGDLILSNSMSFGKPYIMGIEGCIHDGWLLIRDTNNTFDLAFLCHLLSSQQMLDQFKVLAAGSTVNNLNKDLVGNTLILFPKIQEQVLVGQYLEQMDTLITLTQQKLDQLKNLKKALLEKMFV